MLKPTSAHIFSTQHRSMGISNFSDLSQGLLPMLIIQAAILMAAMKQTLYSLFPSLGPLISSSYNMEGVEYSDQEMHDDEGGLDRMNISVGSQLTNLLSFEEEILGKNPLLTLSSSFPSYNNQDCAVCFCSLANGDEISELPCCHLFHRCCITKWFHYQVLQPTCPICRAAQVYDVMTDHDESPFLLFSSAWTVTSSQNLCYHHLFSSPSVSWMLFTKEAAVSVFFMAPM